MDQRELQVILDLVDTLQNTRDAERVLQKTVDFCSRKFGLINCSAYFDKKMARFFDDTSYDSIEKALYSQMQQNKALISISNPKQDFLLGSLTDKEASLVVVPLIVNDITGMIILYKEGISTYIPFIEQIFKRVTPILETCVMLKGAIHSATTDSLTSLYNKAYFLEALKREVERAKRAKRSTSLVIFDLDNFKKYNDTKGHVAGDELLKELGRIIKENIRFNIDIACRYGGEEFTIIMPETDVDDAFAAAERVREACQDSLGETISVGLVTCLNSSESAQSMLKQADKGLYISKDKGKNKTTNFVIIDKSIAPVNCQDAKDFSIYR